MTGFYITLSSWPFSSCMSIIVTIQIDILIVIKISFSRLKYYNTRECQNIFLRPLKTAIALSVIVSLLVFQLFFILFRRSINSTVSLEQLQINLLKQLVKPRNTQILQKIINISHSTTVVRQLESNLILSCLIINLRNFISG